MVNPCGYIDYSPADNLFLPSELAAKPKQVCVFSPADLEIIEKTFPYGHQYYLAIHICLYTGLRTSEALGLHWQDINLKKNELSVCGTMTKRGVWQDVPKTKRSFRTIPFGEKIYDMLLKERKRQSEAPASLFNAMAYTTITIMCVSAQTAASGYALLIFTISTGDARKH